MQVNTSEGSYAICQGMGERRRVDTLLVAMPPPEWVSYPLLFSFRH